MVGGKGEGFEGSGKVGRGCGSLVSRISFGFLLTFLHSKILFGVFVGPAPFADEGVSVHGGFGLGDGRVVCT